MPYHDFMHMAVWQIALEITKEIYHLTEGLPKREDYDLSGQLRSASLSIGANMAEGFGRSHNRDKINFYLYSRGSAQEIKSHLLLGRE